MPVRALDSATLLAVWEEGSTQSAPARALTLLGIARPERSVEQWANATVGERDRALVRVREDLFGTHLEAIAGCPACGERLELAFGTGDILMPAMGGEAPGLIVQVAGYEVRCHPPTSADLASAEDHAALLERCVEIAKLGSATMAPAALPEEVTAAVCAAMAEADPQADIKIALSCPACGETWESMFDILSFLWGEIDDWARRILLDIHVLASAYGWSEGDILGMTPRRRRMYLEMAEAV